MNPELPRSEPEPSQSFAIKNQTPSASRSTLKRVSLREWLVACTAGATLAFSAFGLGGIPAWTLHTLSIGGLVTLLIAFCPMPREAHSSLYTLHSPLQSLKRLARWPFFWCSLLFLLYLLLGALNPAAAIMGDPSRWWVEAIESRWPIWLPTSVQSIYEPMNAWRVIEGFAGSTFLVWGVWAGLTRRKPVILVLWALLLSGAAMAMVGIVQHLTEADAVLWTFPSSNQNFWGSYFYRNQGVAYLNLILITAGVLFFYHGAKSRQRLQSGGPHFLCFVLLAVVVTSIGLALSRGGILFGSILCLVFIALLAVFILRGLESFSSFWTALLPILLLGLGTIGYIRYIDLDAIETRFGDISETIETADTDARTISSRATWDMAQDRLWQGWGAGSFRYIFPMYQRNYPEIFYGRYHPRKQEWIGRRVYHYAHNDILQFIAEYGIIGSSLIALGILSMLVQLILQLNHSTYSTVILLAGVAASLAHAFLDFIFNSPAYWMAFLALIAATTKLVCLEAERSERRS